MNMTESLVDWKVQKNKNAPQEKILAHAVFVILAHYSVLFRKHLSLFFFW